MTGKREAKGRQKGGSKKEAKNRECCRKSIVGVEEEVKKKGS